MNEDLVNTIRATVLCRRYLFNRQVNGNPTIPKWTPVDFGRLHERKLHRVEWPCKTEFRRKTCWNFITTSILCALKKCDLPFSIGCRTLIGRRSRILHLILGRRCRRSCKRRDALGLSLPGLAPQVGFTRLEGFIINADLGQAEFRCNPSSSQEDGCAGQARGQARA